MFDVMKELKEILSYRRGFGSLGNTKFQQEYLVPKIAELGYIPQRMGMNLFVRCGQPTSTLYVSHMDTVHKVKDNTIINTIIEDGDMLRADGTVCLGADDGVGIVVMLYLMYHKVEVDYLFTDGEEHGLVGAHEFVTLYSDILESYTHCIEVDRKGEEEIITHQASGACASKAFADQLSSKIIDTDLPLIASELGVYTDCDAFAQIIPECVNLSAGYYNQHSSKESVNVDFVKKLCLSLKEIDYTSLVVGEREERHDLWWDLDDGPDFGQDLAHNFPNTFGTMEYDECLELVEKCPEDVALVLSTLNLTFDAFYELVDSVEWQDD